MIVTEDNFMDYLKENGLSIGNAARAGDAEAQNVIDWYNIWSKATGDMAAKTVLIEAVKSYAATH